MSRATLCLFLILVSLKLALGGLDKTALLNAHNAERKAVGLPPLVWGMTSPFLACPFHSHSRT